MGLRKASEVPPFFMLESLSDLDGRPITTMFLRPGKYKGNKIDLTIDDIIRANGPREPERDPVAEDLRMGVMLLSAPGQPASELIGEAFQIDNTRRLWTDFYNAAGGGRGKVCTQLLRPCRGDAFELGEPELVESPRLKTKDGAVSHGEPVVVNVKVTNTGDAPGRAALQVECGGRARRCPRRSPGCWRPGSRRRWRSRGGSPPTPPARGRSPSTSARPAARDRRGRFSRPRSASCPSRSRPSTAACPPAGR